MIIAFKIIKQFLDAMFSIKKFEMLSVEKVVTENDQKLYLK